MLVDPEDSLLLVVDLQQRLAPAVAGHEAIEARVVRLIHGARRLRVPVLASEQYPEGLGPTIAPVSALLRPEERIAKRAFSCADEPDFMQALAEAGRGQIVICGMEAHVCVLQTAVELAEARFTVFAVADAMGSRDPANRAVALQRMTALGIEPVTSEMVLFEWLRRSDNEAFRDLLDLIK
ncbi:Nicotinamidase-related amidase [Tistlia consotensis]|uniref:Nicotinamidase-related amidase n=1 Tax=Tistlia consotensis USBA 355 TaxID=560819 RepID=A0A1Y6BWX0_9PROT|nr:hydrolase [Tistlia consotensis]SMF24130.1 Nicotinamidase-related amidase [Tistlia consotensis USBA 355]SNR60877.1 Nicotinamidase-related amidase [Tistlia consotensis]